VYFEKVSIIFIEIHPIYTHFSGFFKSGAFWVAEGRTGCTIHKSGKAGSRYELEMAYLAVETVQAPSYRYLPAIPLSPRFSYSKPILERRRA
jgi:hypothetical protein